jgi:hypothetical protein
VWAAGMVDALRCRLGEFDAEWDVLAVHGGLRAILVR